MVPHDLPRMTCGSISGAVTMSTPQWLDLKVSLGNIITILAGIVGLTVGWTELRADNRRQDQDIVALQRTDAEVRIALQQAASGLRADLAEVKARSDQILEKLVDKQQSTVERVVRVETKVDEILKAVSPPKRM